MLTQWKKAATYAAEEVFKLNEDLLIIVPGLDDGDGGMEAMKRDPIKVEDDLKLVISLHAD